MKSIQATCFLILCLVGLLHYQVKGQAAVASLVLQEPLLSEPFKVEGIPLVYYELRLKNVSDDILELLRLEVRADSAILFSAEAENLRARTGDGLRLLPGAEGVIYLEYTWKEKYGKTLNHQIRYRSGSSEAVAWAPPASISGEEPPVLGPPLKDGPWVAIYDPVWSRGHRRVLYTVENQSRIPGRFAIDFMMLDQDGKTAFGDQNLTINWFGMGQEVLAVADATVAAVRIGFSDSKTLDEHPRYDASEATGNHVSLDLGNGRYAFYEHLQKESIRVVPGQRVRKGEQIAALGFTGQSSGPHLHFHIADTNSALGAEGIPFVFESFEVLGGYPDFNSFGKESWQAYTGPEKVRTGERPASNSVIRFP